MYPRFMLCVALVACKSPPDHIVVTPDSTKLLTLGATAPLVVAGQDVYGKDVPVDGVVWSSSDPTVATVDAAGVITSTGSGRTNVKATAGELTASTTVEVDIFKSATPNAPPFLLVGDTWALSYGLKNEKGETYAAAEPTCVSDAPTVVNLAEGKLVAAAGGVAKFNCTVADNAFAFSVAVISPDLTDLAKSEGDVAADYKWVRDSIGLAPEIKKVGIDNIKLVRFGVHRGKQPFTYELCGSPAEIKMTLPGDLGPINLAVTGPCTGATFPAEAPPWVGAPWMPLLTAFSDRGLKVTPDEYVEIAASAPDTWTMKGGGKVHVVSKAGVVQP